MKLPVVVFLILLCTGCSPDRKQNSTTDQSKDSATTEASELKQSDREDKGITGSDIYFGFSNQTGTRILMLEEDSVASPRIFTKALARDGKITDIVFREKKVQTEQNNGRQWAENFSNSGGNLYETKSATVNPEQTTVLFTDRFLSGRKHIPIEPMEKEQLPASIREKIESEKGRKIKGYQGLGKLHGERSIFLFEFELKGDSALATLAVISPDKIVYKDFPAKYDEYSTWRVDDGGEFGLDRYIIMAAWEYQDKIELITDWIGVEGYSAEYMREEGQTFKTLKEGSRYTAPL